MSENYLGFVLLGTDITPPGLDGNIYRIKVIKKSDSEAEDTIFTEITDITGSVASIKFGDRKYDSTQLLNEISSAKARARIALQLFELGGEYEGSYKDYESITGDNLDSETIQINILKSLHNIRKLSPVRYKIEALDVKGFNLLLDISEDDYMYNAGLLLEKGLVSQSTIDQLNIKNGGIFITHEGIKFLNEKGYDSKVYGVGDAYKFHSDLTKKLIEAKDNVLIVDPYFDAESFDLYISIIPAKVKVRILLKNSSGRFLTVLRKFRASENTNLEVRASQIIHDRVLFIDERCWAIGQSIKDAAMKKPTYVILSEESDMRKKYEPIWKGAERL